MRVLSLFASIAIAIAYGCGGGGAGFGITTQPVLDSMAVTPTTLSVGIGSSQSLNVATFADGRLLTGATFAFASDNTAIATVDGAGIVRGVAAGTAVVSVTASHNGVIRTINVVVNVGGAGPPPTGTSATVTTPGTFFSPAVVTIVPGGSVTWQISGTTHNVTFGAVKPTGGDVPNTQPGNSVTRVFPNAGNFPYECTLHSGMTGSVLVQAGGGGPAPTPDAVVSATNNVFNPDFVEIRPGGTVLWVFSGRTNNVTFEDEAPPGGNIPDTEPGASVARTFPLAGDYDYFSSRAPSMRGRIRVR